MSGKQLPFLSPLAPPSQPQEPVRRRAGLDCENCHGTIEEGDAAIELVVGKIGRGARSGNLMVVRDMGDFPTPIVLHLECIELYARHEIFDGGDDDLFCSSCAESLREDMNE